MAGDWRERQCREALEGVDAFIVENPEYSRQGVEQPGQGATNWVVFARRGDPLVVFKVFCDVERKERECFALRHWAETGLVAQLIHDVDPRTIVMSYIPGQYLPESRELHGDATWRQACRETGKAIGTLTRVPLSAPGRGGFESRFYGELGVLEAYLGRIIELGRSVQARDPDFQDAYWKQNLDFIESQLATIYSRPRILYHQDVGNLHIQDGRFMGFFDLEMCVVGCEAMQLASSLGMLGGDKVGWQHFREGWEAATSVPLSHEDRCAAAAAHHLLCWREISRYLSYDGTPGTGFHWANPADPVRYRKSIESAASMLGVER